MITFLYVILIAIAAFWALVILTVIIVSIHTRLTTTKEEREAMKAAVRKELEEERKKERQALLHAKPDDKPKRYNCSNYGIFLWGCRAHSFR